MSEPVVEAPQYNGVVMHVAPEGLWDLADRAQSQATRMAGAVRGIFGALERLGADWSGQSADEARSFFRELAAACDDVFGSDGSDGAFGGKGGKGVLPAYVDYLKGVAGVFDRAETEVAKSWLAFFGSGAGTGGGSDAPAGLPDPETDWHKTAVSYQKPAS